jgi:hypothetical protein
MSIGKITLLDPTVPATPETVQMASRLPGLEGKRLGLLDNGKLKSDKFLTYVAEILQREYRLAGTMKRRKASPYFPCQPELLEELISRCDLVITGIGD